MISAKLLGRQIEKFTVDNAPIILTAIGAVGSVAATVLSVKATFKACEKIDEHWENAQRMSVNPEGMQPLTTPEKIKVVWKEYLPAAGTLTVSVACIICANRVSTKRLAAMAAAYSLSEKAYGEYREKVIEKFNANKERQVRDEIAQDHVTNNPPRDGQIIITGNGDVLCLDKPTGRYFRSNMEKLRSVQNDVNLQIVEIGGATLGDFYAWLNLKKTPFSDEVGWTSDHPLEIMFSAVLTDDNQPCIAIDYYCKPIRNGATGAAFPESCEDPAY